MKKVKLKIEFDVKSDISDFDIAEWIDFITGQCSAMQGTNKLADVEANDLDDVMKAKFTLSIND